MGRGAPRAAGERHLLLLARISVPLLQSTVALGAARGWQAMVTSPPRAAGIRRRTGFCLKSGASAGRTEDSHMVTHVEEAAPVTLNYSVTWPCAKYSK